MSELDEIEHEEFSYMEIPMEINRPVKVHRFKGKEADFKSLLRCHFGNHEMTKTEKGTFYDTLKEKAKGNLTDQHFTCAMEASHTYQIIPLTIPHQSNKFEAINAYIDNVGRVKNLRSNSRASRICSTDIRGDCFLSRTFDDEETFKRTSFTMADYETLLQCPPESKNRWDQNSALEKLLKQPTDVADSTPSPTPQVPHCSNCCMEETKCDKIQDADVKPISLRLCTGCKKVYYCSVECQKHDWPSHKRICKAINT